MGFLIPTLLAFILSSCGVCIFHDAGKAGCEPLVSSLIFLFGVFLLLWDLRLFPSSLRTLVQMAALIMHFLLATFCMEHIMNDFWFPLEASMIAFLPKVADYEACVLKQFGWKSPGMLRFLKSDISHVMASYAMSLFFLVTMLHATRLIDLRLLRCGRDVFIEDIMRKMRRSWRKFVKKWTKRAMKFQNSECNICDEAGPSRSRKGYR